jgi:hypothetical protein
MFARLWKWLSGQVREHRNTIVAMCEDGRRRSSVFLSSTIPERTTRQVVGREPHFSVSQIGDIHLFGGRSAH